MSEKVRLDSLFRVEYGTQFDLNKMDQTNASDPEGVSFVSRSRENLGVTAFVRRVNDIEPLDAGLITVTLGGSYLLSAFVQERQFYTAQNVAVLTPKDKMSFAQKLYYCLCLGRNRQLYSAFGREANRTLGQISVPKIVPGELAAFQLDVASPSRDALLEDPTALTSHKWKSFKISDLFEVTGTKTTTIGSLMAVGTGKHPYVTTRATNNGVRGFFDHATEKGNVLAVDSAVIGYCSYQRDDFSASDHVEKLVPKFEMNQYLGLFLATVINRDQYRYSYGRKASQKRLRKASIRLPATEHDEPDWQFMENVVKSLPYSKSI